MTFGQLQFSLMLIDDFDFLLSYARWISVRHAHALLWECDKIKEPEMLHFFSMGS